MKHTSELERRSRTALSELDEIVVQLFDDMDVKNEAVQPASDLRPSSRQSLRRTTDGQSDESMKTEPTETKGSESAVEEVLSQQLLDPSDESDKAQTESFPRMTRPGIELSIPSEDQDFIERAVSWLAKRPNAEHLLEQIWLSVIEHAAAEERACGAADESDGGPTQPIPNLRYSA
jgi:hypothetical protein